MKAKRERRMMFMGVMTGAASAAGGLEPTVSAIISLFQMVRAFEKCLKLANTAMYIVMYKTRGASFGVGC